MKLTRKIIYSLLISTSLFSDSGILTKIVDGDTLYFERENETVKCRIEHIDTPESKINSKSIRDVAGCRNVSEKEMKAAGKSATAKAKNLLIIGKIYNYKTNGKDRYGRSICLVVNNKEIFNEQMVSNGYAVPYRAYMNQNEKNRFNALLESARKNGNGLWGKQKNVMECLNEKRK